MGWGEEGPRGDSASVPYRGVRVMTEELTFLNLWLERTDVTWVHPHTARVALLRSAYPVLVVPRKRVNGVRPYTAWWRV